MIISKEQYNNATEYLQIIEKLAATYFNEENVWFDNRSYEDCLKNTFYSRSGANIIDSVNDTNWESVNDRYIFIRWINLVVKNELDQSITIPEFFVKLVFSSMGIFKRFTMTSTGFTSTQLAGQYNHSHVPMLYNSKVATFSLPCLGSGPIRNTQENLAKYGPAKNDNFNNECSFEFETDWLFFFTELDTYVHTESLDGGPYIRLNSISSNSVYYKDYNIYDVGYDRIYYTSERFNVIQNISVLDTFIKWYLPKTGIRPRIIKSPYTKSISATLPKDITSIYIDITEKLHLFVHEFPELRETFEQFVILCKYQANTHKFVITSTSREPASVNYDNLNKIPLFIFKDKILYQKVINSKIEPNSDQEFYTFDSLRMGYIISKLLIHFNVLLTNGIKRKNTILV